MSDDNGPRIRRRARGRHYAIIANEPIEDRRISWEALGVLTYLLSKPDDWETHPRQLAGYREGGRDRMRRILSELRTVGYLDLIRERDSKTGHVKGSYYEVIETPGDHREPENPTVGLSGSRISRQSAQPTVGKAGPLVSTDVDVDTDSVPITHSEECADGNGSEQRQAADNPHAPLFAALGIAPGREPRDWLATADRSMALVEAAGADPIEHARQLAAELGRVPSPMEYTSRKPAALTVEVR